MKRYFTLAILILLAASCGGRHGKQDGDGTAADSLATETAQKPAEKSRAAKSTAKVDTVSVANYKNRLPQEPIFDIVTSMGTIRVKLYKDTPKHRDNFTRLAISHYYDDVLFHRVINGFIIQGGDPFTRDTSRVEEWGEGGPGYTIDAEIVPEHRHQRGALAAARRGNLANPMKESSGSQFYLVQDSTNCKPPGPAGTSRGHPARPPERSVEQTRPGRGDPCPGDGSESVPGRERPQQGGGSRGRRAGTRDAAPGGHRRAPPPKHPAPDYHQKTLNI